MHFVAPFVLLFLLEMCCMPCNIAMSGIQTNLFSNLEEEGEDTDMVASGLSVTVSFPFYSLLQFWCAGARFRAKDDEFALWSKDVDS